jgi:hypothetical protein
VSGVGFGRVPASASFVEPIAEARVELLRECKHLLEEWELDRHPVTRGMLLARLESLRLLVAVEP